MTLTRINPGGGGNRPLPDPPRLPEDAQNMKVYALLVGINDYQGDINPLDGCVNDVKNVKKYLEEKYGDRLKLKVLLNKEATYENIIQAFDDHLVNGGGTGNDTFWFHFSGHGSEMFSAEAFFKPKNAAGEALPSLAPNGKDQTLVCYNPGGTDKGIFIADKELAVLLKKIHDNARSLGQKKPHVLVSLDCCHSGSGTRAGSVDGIKERRYDFLKAQKDRLTLVTGTQTVRPLESYYNGWYTKQIQGDESKLRIPHSQHLLISGCTNLELAGDTADGGIFTGSLVKSLREVGDEPLNYTDLFIRTRAKTKASKKSQTPQFEAIGNFNPYTAVLEGWALGEPGKYEIKFQNGRWFVRAGAINGLPMKPFRKPDSEDDEAAEKADDIQVLIFRAKGHQLVGSARVAKVGVQDSRLSNFRAAEKGADGQMVITDKPLKLDPNSTRNPLDPTKHYVAEIFTLPAEPVYIQLTGDPQATGALLAQWDKQFDQRSVNLDNLNILPITSRFSKEKPEVEVKAAEVLVHGERRNTYTLINRLNGKEWTHIGGTAEQPVEMAKEAIDKIAKWKRMLALNNDGSSLQNTYKLEFMVTTLPDYEDAGEPDPFDEPGKFLEMMQVHTAGGDMPEPHTGTPPFLSVQFNEQEKLEEVVIHATIDDFFAKDEHDSLPYAFRLRTTTAGDDLYFYLFDLESNCAISVHQPGELHLEKTIENQLHMFKSGDGSGTGISDFRLGFEEQEASFWYKLFVTRKPIDVEALTQSGLAKTKGETGLFIPTSRMEDWHCTTLKVTIKRVDERS